jgi:hypothetical protein
VRAWAPCLGRTSGPLVGRPDGALPLLRGRAGPVVAGPISCNVFPKLVTKLNCKCNGEMCRNPKIMKQILLVS